MKRTIRNFRWFIADYLSRVACRLRGHTWYVDPDVWHGVPGNRASALHQSIWQGVTLIDPRNEDTEDTVNRINAELCELAQAAKEAWGHIPPK